MFVSGLLIRAISSHHTADNNKREGRGALTVYLKRKNIFPFAQLRMSDIDKKWEKIGGKWVEKKPAEEMWESEKGFKNIFFYFLYI